MLCILTAGDEGELEGLREIRYRAELLIYFLLASVLLLLLLLAVGAWASSSLMPWAESEGWITSYSGEVVTLNLSYASRRLEHLFTFVASSKNATSSKLYA